MSDIRVVCSRPESCSRFSYLKKNRATTQEDCGQCSMLTVVPEMYTPNPTYGADATGAECTTLATVDGTEFNIPDCMPWAIFDGKILFRLSAYEYTRSRADEACQVSN